MNEESARSSSSRVRVSPGRWLADLWSPSKLLRSGSVKRERGSSPEEMYLGLVGKNRPSKRHMHVQCAHILHAFFLSDSLIRITCDVKVENLQSTDLQLHFLCSYFIYAPISFHIPYSCFILAKDHKSKGLFICSPRTLLARCSS